VKKKEDQKKKKEKKKEKKKAKGRQEKQKYSEDYSTAMQLLQEISPPRKKNDSHIPFGDLIGLDSKPDSNDYRDAKRICEKLEEKDKKLWEMRRQLKRVSTAEKKEIWRKMRRIEEECVDIVRKKMRKDGVLARLLELVEEKDEKSKKFRSLLFSCICSATDTVYQRLSLAAEGQERCQIEQDSRGSVRIMGVGHSVKKC
jgi:hypothetical protein